MLNTLKRSAAVFTLAAVLSTFSLAFIPTVSEAAPPPRGGFRVVRHQPVPRPVIHKPPMHRPGPVYRPAPRPHWRPAPPPPRPRYDYREARRNRRIARGIAAVAVVATLLGAR